MVNNDMINKGIYIELDALLDTRFSTLLFYAPNIAVKASINNDYRDRLIDEFDYINAKTFNRLYSLRDVDTLRHSFITNITDVLIVDITNRIKTTSDIDNNPYIYMDINTYPYSLPTDIKNKIKKLIADKLGVDIVIEFIHKVPEELTLDYVNAKYFSIYMYKGLNWLTYHIENSTGYAINTALVVPAILDKVVTNNTQEDYEKMFTDCAKALVTYIMVRFVPSNMYSMLKK